MICRYTGREIVSPADKLNLKKPELETARWITILNSVVVECSLGRSSHEFVVDAFGDAEIDIDFAAMKLDF